MLKQIFAAASAFACVLVLAACGAQGDATPTPVSSGTEATPTSDAATYPQVGHALDYTWIAGRVTFTKIQSGCVYIFTDPADIAALESALTPQPATTVITGPIVSTAVNGSTSLPLRDITPEAGVRPTDPPTSRFVPSGDGWDESAVKDGDYVVLLGRLATANDTQELCPGGSGYVVDSIIKK